MVDAITLGALLLCFATLVTTHVAIAARLLGHHPRYRGLVALVVPPLAPWWAHEKRWRVLVWLWVGSTVGYAVARVVAEL
jgi:hypothetical protein